MANSSSPWADFSGINPYTLNISIVPGATHDLSKLKFNPGSSAWANMFMPTGTSSPESKTPPISPSDPNAVPNTGIESDWEKQWKFYSQHKDEIRADRAAEYQQQAELTRQQLADTYPYMSAAASEATARNLAASKQFAAFKETAPSNIQNIMASKQGQASSAADAEYRRAMGIAAQQAAATDFARKFAGQTFQQG